MDVYKKLNEITLYIDQNLDNEIYVADLGKMMGVNSYTFERLFSLLTGFTVGEYIRKRRLFMAGLDLYNEECFVMDVAIKYGYESATSFSRAFEAFHGIKPSKLDDISQLVVFPRITFDENAKITSTIEYKIVTLEDMTLYGLSIDVNNKNIKEMAPKLFEEAERKYGMPKYGLVTYENALREKCNCYMVLYEHQIPESKEVFVPGGKYLAFTIDSQETKDIQNTSDKFYLEFLPTCKYNLRETPEIEYYHDDITEFYVPIC